MLRNDKKSLIGLGMVQAPFSYLCQNGCARRRLHFRPSGDFVECAKTPQAKVVLVKAATSDTGRD
jgi:hypothetical protein